MNSLQTLKKTETAVNVRICQAIAASFSSISWCKRYVTVMRSAGLQYRIYATLPIIPWSQAGGAYAGSLHQKGSRTRVYDISTVFLRDNDAMESETESW